MHSLFQRNFYQSKQGIAEFYKLYAYSIVLNESEAYKQFVLILNLNVLVYVSTIFLMTMLLPTYFIIVDRFKLILA